MKWIWIYETSKDVENEINYLLFRFLFALIFFYFFLFLFLLFYSIVKLLTQVITSEEKL